MFGMVLMSKMATKSISLAPTKGNLYPLAGSLLQTSIRFSGERLERQRETRERILDEGRDFRLGNSQSLAKTLLHRTKILNQWRRIPLGKDLLWLEAKRIKLCNSVERNRK